MVGAGEPAEESLQERARTPEKISELLPLLQQGTGEERAGLREMETALDALGIDSGVKDP